MIYKSILGATCACLAVVSVNVNAVVLNTLNGVDYEWLELTETTGLSRLQVETQLTDVNSALYGYEYASRSLVEDLFLSYATWDGQNGWHGNSFVTEGTDRLLTDFGITFSDIRSVTTPTNTVDGISVNWIDGYGFRAFYGTAAECTSQVTCSAELQIKYDALNNPAMVYQDARTGWDSQSTSFHVNSDVGYSEYGSFLVKTSVVPVPAAVWLFGSGLLGLTGLARRKVRV